MAARLATQALLALSLTLCLFSSRTQGFYVPGITPHGFAESERVPLFVNKVSSEKTQLPIAWYDLPVCPLEQGTPRDNYFENLGEILRGDRVQNSDFKVEVLKDIPCAKLCTLKLDAEKAESLRRIIQNEYKADWILDNLPVATVYIQENADNTKTTQYEPGFLMGSCTNDECFINNHISMRIWYNKKVENGKASYLIVGFEVYPKSVDNSQECADSKDKPKPQLVPATGVTISYTYSIVWQESDITWNHRWDRYLSNGTPQIHWYAIIHSFNILLFMSAVVAVVIVRTLRKDIATYNDEESKDDQEDTTGWKLVHGDVFRPPKNGGILAPMLGSGIQFIFMIFITMVFAVLGFLNPSYRGGLEQFSIVLYVFMGVFGGYYSSRMYKFFKGQSWKRNGFNTALLFPGIIGGFMFLLNFFKWGSHSTSALPFGTMVALGAMWFGISLPLGMIGSYFGFKKQVIESPVRTNQIPRQVPEQVWYLRPLPSIMLSGLLPFFVVIIELAFIFQSMWNDQFHYVYGFLFLVLTFLLITCVEVTIVVIYFQLCGEDYHWWWRSFFVASSSSVYIFLYSIFYFVDGLRIVEFVPIVVYFVEMLVGCFIYFLCTGTVGFFATFYFIRKIYAAVKVE